MNKTTQLAQLYYSLILQGKRTINEVPTRYRKEVDDLLSRDGKLEYFNSDSLSS